MLNIINSKSVQLKILKFLASHKQKRWCGSRVAREIYSTWVVVAKHLKFLESKKFLSNKAIDGRTNGWSITNKGEKVVVDVLKLEKLLK